VVVIATDGKPTDGSLGETLATFHSLPVYVVVRLCTDNDSVHEYWQHVDEEELKGVAVQVDVLDDFEGEAKEVNDHNPWLNYSQPLHRAREIGANHTVLDRLDDHTLTHGEMWEFMRLIFGWGSNGGADPKTCWGAFEALLRANVNAAGKTW
jgi:hypothetical protein